MAGVPKLDLDVVPGLGSGQMNGFRMGSRTQAMPIPDPIVNGRSDSFIVDLGNLSNEGLDKDVSANPRVNMQRNFSRKGSVQGGDQESLLVSSSSPRAGSGCNRSTTETVAVEVAMEPSNTISQAAIRPSSFTANSKSSSSSSSSKWGRRYNSFKRSSQPYWVSDPKRVLLFFANLSSIGTILLIYFTLYASNSYETGTDAEG